MHIYQIFVFLAMYSTSFFLRLFLSFFLFETTLQFNIINFFPFALKLVACICGWKLTRAYSLHFKEGTNIAARNLRNQSHENENP